MEGGTRRKEERGGRRNEEEGGTRGRDEESEKMKKLFKKMKNEKVAKGRVIGLAGPCSLICVVLNRLLSFYLDQIFVFRYLILYLLIFQTIE